MVKYAVIKKSKIKKMDALRAKYPFLNQIITQQPYPLFNIEEAVVDESILADKCCDHGSEGPETFDEQVYFIYNGEVIKMAGLFNAGRGKRAVYPSPSVREELSSQRITPDFLVKTRHLKYEIRRKINHQDHNDVSLTVYRF